MPQRIAFFTASLRIGGVERFVVNLSAEFARRGYLVDVVLVKAEGPFLEQLHNDVRVVDLNSRRVLTSLPGLVRYLRRESPTSLLTLQTHCNIIGVVATAIASRSIRRVGGERNAVGARLGRNVHSGRVGPRVIVSEHNSSRARIAGARRKEATLLRLTPLFYRRAQGIVAVSSDLADELSDLTGQERGRINVIFNAVVTDELRTMAESPPEHPWFAAGQPPVILNVGRLVPQKDQATLLRAFARLRMRRAARLLVIGDGPERAALETLADQLGITADLSMPGFDTNPYRYMRNCQVFVLSSAWEGFGNVLVEAMACGAPVVSTDCRSGPAEILDQGKYGLLVPVGDDEALASAIQNTLDSPLLAEVLQQRASVFSVSRCADEYLKLLLPGSK
jgi:glycosyltransferase involved in cell wall biosynthesis